MSRLHRLIACLALIGCSALSAPATAADGPTYLILRGPAPRKSDSLHVLHTQPYAYGWFGAQPRYRFRGKSNGYYGSNTQWIYR